MFPAARAKGQNRHVLHYTIAEYGITQKIVLFCWTPGNKTRADIVDRAWAKVAPSGQITVEDFEQAYDTNKQANYLSGKSTKAEVRQETYKDFEKDFFF
jgi:hypothetical protein